MKDWWWKILGLAIVFFTLVFGMITPLKPGILSVTPSSFLEGEKITVDVAAYNSNFSDSNGSIAYLRIDKGQYIPSGGTIVKDRNHIQFDFTIPANVTALESTVLASLIVTNEEDGYFTLPSAISINKNAGINLNNGVKVENTPSLLHENNTYKFPYRSILNETIRNTFFHITLWFSMFILLIGAVYQAARYLRTKDIDNDHKSRSLTVVAVLFGILGLVTGSIWARFTWGTWWTSDVKLNMAAISMLMYVAYFVLRSSIKDQDQKARLASAYSIFAFFVMIPLVFVLPRLTDSLHPGNGGNPALGGEDLDNTLRMIFYPAIIGFTLIGVWMATLYYRYIVLEETVALK
jgi:heme exporter protein C